LINTMFSLIFTAVPVAGADRFTVGVTDWGSWGDWSYCDDGHFFVGYRLKIEAKQGGWDKTSNPNDDTAMNAIQFICDNENPKDSKFTTMDPDFRTSKQGQWGEWHDWLFCPEKSYITGVRFFSDPAGAGGVKASDDTAANNMHVWCKGGNSVDQWAKYMVNEDNTVDRLYGWGKDMTDKHCESGNAISGFQTKVEDHQGSGDTDDTALNQLKVECTEAPGCVKIRITNVVPDAQKMETTEEPDSLRYSEILNCDYYTPSPWSYSMNEEDTYSFKESYTTSETFSAAFGLTLSQSVAVEVSAGFTIPGAEFGAKSTTEFSSTQSISTEISSTDTTVEETVTSKMLSSTTSWSKDCPPWSKCIFAVTYSTYVGKVPYKADAICYDNNDDEVSRKEITGYWEGTTVSEAQFYPEDLTEDCENRHVCECAGVFSTIGGQNCNTDDETPDRGTWCYIFSGACGDDAGDLDLVDQQVSTIVESKLSQSTFQWSNAPCRRRLGVAERLPSI